ncbi:recQ-like DNA helicase BLM isoform X1 [Dreissena polymorpha]|uniref:recQ-like DNA helicase BLM isoform X1 n=1 Tax=Dreissena polymorpha TaxID=45954 RepID=UPI00226440D1|nr:recQ-like DNA helicase BLM isoform X1 [Dreissena polymorpha]
MLWAKEYEDIIKEPYEKLKQAVTRLMPAIIKKYEEERAALEKQEGGPKERQSKKEEVGEASSEEADDKKTGQSDVAKKRQMGPRKIFPWDTGTRDGLCDVVRIKMQTFKKARTKSQSAEEFCKGFLKNEVLPLWPKGWMETRFLYRESKTAHHTYTKPLSSQKPKKTPVRNKVRTSSSLNASGASTSGANTTMTEKSGSAKPGDDVVISTIYDRSALDQTSQPKPPRQSPMSLAMSKTKSSNQNQATDSPSFKTSSSKRKASRTDGKYEMSDSQSKKRRTLEFPKEDMLDRTRPATTSPFATRGLQQDTMEQRQATPTSACDDMKALDLQYELLKVADRICDHVSQLSMSDIMNCFKVNSRAVQNLLHQRTEIKSQASGRNLMDRIFISNCTAGDVGRARDSTSIAISKQITAPTSACDDMKALDLQYELLKVADRICDHVSQLSMSDIMNCFKVNSRAVQNLLHQRTEIKSQASGRNLMDRIFISNCTAGDVGRARDSTSIAISKQITAPTDDSPIASTQVVVEERSEYASYAFEHCKEMMKVFNKVFGLQRFKTHQLEACNATLLDNDTFVLMPTGGGKSLCYQLPALVNGGVTIVVSPLRALIQDQVQKLQSLNVPAGHLSGDVTPAEEAVLYEKLDMRTPEIRLLYVTPEKLSASEKLLGVLENLFSRLVLDRFVIDEAHCISSWGHDFRPDYKKLGMLKIKFPGVPLMALTSTATMRVRKDICNQLHMKDPKWFISSFNRPNLKFECRPKKTSTATNDIIKMIKTDFLDKCGIVYCLSRKECESVSWSLTKAGILSQSYHAGLRDAKRVKIQEKWMHGNKCKVICATTAFGMGIDKPDVRFVIHYSLPKSVEGYYQEAGRAGRDEQLAYCILLYSYKDVEKHRWMIETDKNVTVDSKSVHHDNLLRMVEFCENVADCRRTQLLDYFNETGFDRVQCNKIKGSICDNCISKDPLMLRDVTEDVKAIIACVKDLTANSDFTLKYFMEMFKGSNDNKIVENCHDRHAMHGRGAACNKQDVDRLFRKLVIDGILIEEPKITAKDHVSCYIKLGRKAQDVISGKMKVELQVQGNRKKKELIGTEPVSEELRTRAEEIALRKQESAVPGPSFSSFKSRNSAIFPP